MKGVKLLRLGDVLEIIPISKSSWWKGVAEGRLPHGLLAPRTTVWYLEDILELLDRIKEESLG